MTEMRPQRPLAKSARRGAKPAAARRNPERTRELILDAATEEFSARGLGGARVDAIAERAGTNKRMLYHYFGNKEGLYLAVLERAYAHIRGYELELHLSDLEPLEAMARLVTYTFDYYVEHPEFLKLLGDENLHKAEHIRRSRRIPEMHSPLVGQLIEILRRGEVSGVFRKGVDPVQLYISIAGVSYFYFSNIHTLATIFSRRLDTARALAERRRHAVEVITHYLKP
jgi:AcrR family transcriptional regulator